MKKNKGFTIIELLAVIVLLALIMILVIPAIINVLDNAKKESFYLYANNVYEKAVNKYVQSENDASRSDINCSVYRIPEDLDISNSGDYKGWVKVERESKGSGNYKLSINASNDNGVYNVRYCTKYNADCNPEDVSGDDSTFNSNYWEVGVDNQGKQLTTTSLSVTTPKDYHLCVQYQYPNGSGTMQKSEVLCNYSSEEIMDDTYEYKVTLTMKDKDKAVENFVLQNNTKNKDENKRNKQDLFNAIDAYKATHSTYETKHNDDGSDTTIITNNNEMPLTELVCSGTGSTISNPSGSQETTRPTTTVVETSSIQVTTQVPKTNAGSILLNDLNVTGYPINFSPTHLDYRFSVPYGVTSLNITYSKNSDDVNVEIVGANNIIVGSNLIVVHAWNDKTSEEVYYYITVIRIGNTSTSQGGQTQPVITTIPVSDEPDPTLTSSNAKLSNILIAGYELSDVFSPDTYAYDIEIDPYVNELSINPVLQEVTSRYEISGNHNLQEGSKIQITVLSQNGFYHNIYTLTVHVKKKTNHSTVILRTVAVGLAGVLIVLLVMMKKQKASDINVETNKSSANNGGVVQPTQINKK